jgi:hypothetical protein
MKCLPEARSNNLHSTDQLVDNHSSNLPIVGKISGRIRGNVFNVKEKKSWIKNAVAVKVMNAVVAAAVNIAVMAGTLSAVIKQKPNKSRS